MNALILVCKCSNMKSKANSRGRAHVLANHQTGQTLSAGSGWSLAAGGGSQLQGKQLTSDRLRQLPRRYWPLMFLPGTGAGPSWRPPGRGAVEARLFPLEKSVFSWRFRFVFMRKIEKCLRMGQKIYKGLKKAKSAQDERRNHQAALQRL